MKKTLVLGMAGAVTLVGVAWAGHIDGLRWVARALAGSAPGAPSTAALTAAVASEPVAPIASTAETSRSSRYAGPAGGAELGDPGTFGRPVRFLGAMNSPGFYFSTNCGAPAGTSICIPVDPTTGAANMSFPDVVTQSLPAHSMQNLLCHWATPFVSVNFVNRSGLQRRRHFAQLAARVTLHNPALVLPHRTDPSTRAPLNGAITFGLPLGDVAQRLDANEAWAASTGWTRACFNGYFSRSILASQYGLSEDEIRAVYASPTQLRMRLDITTQGVDSGNASYHVRWIGD